MKTAAVPAQITTVEDKIAGNLTLQQIILLACPIFIDFGFYALLPQTLKLSTYKIVLMTLLTLVTSLLAIRVKGKLVLTWTQTIYRYNSRPQYYLFNKNNMHLRHKDKVIIEEALKPKQGKVLEQDIKSNEDKLSQQDIAKLEYILADTSEELLFVTDKRGGLHVNITKI